MEASNHAVMAFVILLAGICGIAPLCHAETAGEKTTIEDVKQDTQDLLQSLKSYSSEQRDEAIRATEEALADLDRRIDALEAWIDERWDEMDAAAREKAQASLKALRKQRTEVAEWYGQLKSSSADAWSRIKRGFAEAYKALSDAWAESEEEFGPDQRGI
ncbi:MAG: hypothetical protein J5I92_08705 [Thiogranum sp.]|nr:hypothetical protein [Thiogranum sp.]